MKIDIALDHLPDLYENVLSGYSNGVPFEELGYEQLSGRKSHTVGVFIKLFEDIKNHGYEEPARGKHRSTPIDVPPKYRLRKSIMGVVEPHGYLIIRGGYHRISILKHLKYHDVPVEITMNSSFEIFYNHMLGVQGVGKWLYHPVDYWVFSTWKSARGLNRADLIMSKMTPGTTVLDLGCHVGGITNQLAMNGFYATGVDKYEKNIYCAKYLADYYAWRDEAKKAYPNPLGHLSSYPNYHKPTYLLGDIGKIVAGLKNNDYTLFLSVYRWLKKAGIADDVLRRLGKITNKAIYMDVEAYLEEELKQKILELTKFTRITKIGVETKGIKAHRHFNEPRNIYEVS